MDNLKVISFNTRGLGNDLKRRRTFRYVKKYKPDVCMLQETHCESSKEHIWSNQFGNNYVSIYSNGNTKSCGVVTILKKKLAENIVEIRRDMCGRFVICKVKINEYTYGVVNLYAPNTDETTFFQEIMQHLQELDCVYNIMGGDFNCALDPMDRCSGNIYHKQCSEILNKELNDGNMIDPWRRQNPESKAFTWMRGRSQLEWSRIDYFLVSNSLSNKCYNPSILPSVVSDHSLIYLEVDVNDQKRGPGLWKFNNQLLNDKIFSAQLEMIIKGVLRVYEYLNPIDLWELLKHEMVRFSKQYATEKAAGNHTHKFSLYETLSRMQNELLKDNWGQQLLSNIQGVKNEITAFEIMDAKRAAFRCRMDWAKHGEVNSKYYFNIEKCNYVSKTMYTMRRSDGSLTKDYSEILQIQHKFYYDLYSSNSAVNFSIQNVNNVTLDTASKDKFEHIISEAEMFDALMTLKLGKTPGCDGITLELLKSVWRLVSKPMHNMYVEAFRQGQLNPSGRRGVINLIPKRNKDLTYVKHWRPITLLSYDFKLWAKAISNRLEEVSGYLIGRQQNGFIKKRNIFTNIRTTAEVVSYLSNKKEDGVVVLIDFEKCFDRVEYESIRGTFRYFGFGEKFIQMLFLLFTNLELCTVNNGFTSEFFVKKRGVNQGCPASPQVFCYCSEKMAHLLYQNSDIKGLSVRGIEQLLSQFADDTSAYLKYEQICIKAFTDMLACVEKQMGLKVSYEKTTVYRIGSLYNTNAKMYTTKSLKWSNEAIDTLGVSINCDGTLNPKNYTEVLTKLRNVVNVWVNRRATLYGKVLIVNMLMGSLFVYKMTTMLALSTVNLKEIEGIIREFLWNGKKTKIALKTLQGLKDQGSLNLIDVKTKQQVIQCSWIFKLEMKLFSPSVHMTF